MGVIRPPWVTKRWFKQCPFNYCDHFGDKKVLATVCKICKEEVEDYEEAIRKGEDPHSMERAFKKIGESLAETLVMVKKQARELGIDIENLPEEEDDTPPNESYPIFNTVCKYGDRVERAMKELQLVPVDADTDLIVKAVDALAHSRFYISAKIGRALSSRWDEQKDPKDDLDDSKTSAFLAYIAIERNSRALLALARHKPLQHLKAEHLKLAKTSIVLCEAIQEEFFPEDKLVYEELGYIEYE